MGTRNRLPTIAAPEGFYGCPRCKMVKPLFEFGVNNRRKTGISVYCKPCTQERQRALRKTWTPTCTPEQAAEFDARLDKTHPGGCWVFTGHVRKKDGYGQLSFAGRTMTAHQAAMLIQGHWPAAQGLQIDHMCRNLLCANPAHLRIVTPRQNCLENNSNTWALNYAKTHCVHGHEFTPENTYRQRGNRGCRACTILHARAAAVAKRLGLPPRDCGNMKGDSE